MLRNQADVIAYADRHSDAKLGTHHTICLDTTIHVSCCDRRLTGSWPRIREQISRSNWRLQAGTNGGVLAIVADGAGM